MSDLRTVDLGLMSRGLFAAAGLGLLVVGAAGLLGPGRSDAQPRGPTVRLTGILTLVPPQASTAVAAPALGDIELPDARVELRDAAGAPVAKAVTTLDGRFVLRAPGGARYRLCWQVGGESGCGKEITLGKSTVSAGRVPVRLAKPVIVGRVLTADERPCWISDSFFGLDVYTKVQAETGGGGAGSAPARANTQGEYVLTDLAAGPLTVRARCEKAEALQAGNALRRDLTLPNHAPVVTGLAAMSGGKAITAAAPGAALKLAASTRDADGDSVEYLWRSLDDPAALSGGSGPTQGWKTPAEMGKRSVYLMVRDGRGGYAYRRLDLAVGDGSLTFSGRVVDEVTKAPLNGAMVSVGGASAATNAQGWYSLRTAPLPGDRYVLNVSRRGYAAASRVYDQSASGDTVEMIAAQVTTVSGTGVITLADATSSGPCGQGKDGRARPLKRLAKTMALDAKTDRPAAVRPTSATTAAAATQPTCKRRGASLTIPAGALVDARGRAAGAGIVAQIATLNPARRALPGDYQAVTAGGERAELLSYGAVYAEFRDAGGAPLNLRPGATAEISVPVSDAQRPSAKPKIALWSYDTASGRWIEEGQATLTNTASGWAYVGTTKHFSTLNMDVAGTDPNFATCVRVELSSDFSAWSNLVLRAYVSYGGNSVQVKETPLDGAQYHAIYRIPYNTGFPNSLRLELRGTFGGQQVLLLDNIINTDARPKMTGTDLWPPYPYTACGDPVLLTTAPGVVPPYGDLDGAGRPAFLAGPFGDLNPPNGEALATDYYQAVDGGNQRTTLGDWWQLNGFGADGLSGVGQVRAAYLNHNDLGFGRDMNCVSGPGGKLACYVTNYGAPDQNPANADAAEARDPAKRGATVTMEYDPAALNDENVQFYVFNGGVAGATRIKFADLDGFGPKPVPHLCTVCHGGQPPTGGATKVQFARFREFDLPSFRYSGARSWDFGQASLTAPELASYAQLNQKVQAAHAATPIGDLIGRWYPLGFVGGPAPVLPSVPAGWAGQAAGYHAVYAKSCRTCHVARDEGDPNAFYVFANSGAFSGTGYVVCGFGAPKRRVMPNAVVTYKNFWADAPRVSQFEILTGTPAGTCGS